MPNEPIQKLDELLTMLDQKLFSLVDDEIPDIKADDALSQAMRTKYTDLSASFNSMKDSCRIQESGRRTKYVAAVLGLVQEPSIFG